MSASPAQFGRLAWDLFERGHNVLVPRLPHHGHANRMSTALARLSADELYESVCEYVSIAAELGERVTVAGFSLGGLLAAWAAQHFAVDRSVPISPFFGVSWIPNRLMGGVATLALRAPNQFHWWNPILRDRQPIHCGYPRYCTHAVAHSYRIARGLLDQTQIARPIAGHVTFVTNSGEVAVNNSATRRLYRNWRRLRPDSVELSVLTGLPLSHDILSPARRPALIERAHPHLLSAIDP